MATPQCWIVTATLDVGIGNHTMALATSSAGCPTLVHVEVDLQHEGGVKTANCALRVAMDHPTPFICYVNDDVTFPQQDWLKKLIEVLETNDKYGLAGPSGNCSTVQRTGKRGDYYEVKEIGHELSFFCVVFRRELIEQIGYLDECFIHYACDNDYCIRAKKAGWFPVWARHVFVQHDRSPTVADWKEHDLIEYYNKWPEGSRMRK